MAEAADARTRSASMLLLLLDASDVEGWQLLGGRAGRRGFYIRTPPRPAYAHPTEEGNCASRSGEAFPGYFDG